MLDQDIAHCSYPGGVRAAENHGVPNVKGGAMNEHGGMPKGEPVAKKIGKAAGKTKPKDKKADMKSAFGKKVGGK